MKAFLTAMIATVYSSPLLYTLAMRALYGRHFSDRYRAIADLVSPGAEVVDVCCGDARLYTHYLRQRDVSYLGLDNAPRMIDHLARNSVPCRVANIWSDEIPKADIVILQASLCQFIPHQRRIVEKLFRAARQRVIIAEPVRNLCSSSNRFIASVAQLLTRPSAGTDQYQGKRFDEQSLEAFFRTLSVPCTLSAIPGGREMIAVFELMGAGETETGIDRGGMNYERADTRQSARA